MHLSGHKQYLLISGLFQPSTTCLGICFTQFCHLTVKHLLSVVPMKVPSEGRETDQPHLLLEMLFLGIVKEHTNDSFLT